MSNILFRIFLLLAVSSVAAVFTNAVRRDGLPWVIDPNTSIDPGENPSLAARVSITIDEVRDHLNNMTATFVDARKPDEFARSHLAAAINIPATEKEQYIDSIFEIIPPDGLIIIYCEGGGCESSYEVFKFLVSNGFRIESLRIFYPGWEILGGLSDIPVVSGTE